MKELSRRDFIKGGAVLVVGFGIGAARFKSESAPSSDTLTMDGAFRYVDHYTKLLSAIPQPLKQGITTQQQVDAWTQEIVPFFGYEGVDDPKAKVNEQGGLQYPSSDVFEYYQDGQDHNHILGTTSLLSKDVTLNARMSNPESSWYGREDSLMTLVHELAHVQGIVFSQDRIDTEASAQLVALEVTASLINRENKMAVAPFFDELRHQAIQTARYLGRQEGNEAGFFRERDKYLTPLEKADWDKSDRHWEEDPDTLNKIIYSYNFVPFTEMLNGLRNSNRIDGVELPVNWLADMINNHEDYAAGYYEEPTETPGPTPTPYPTKPLIIDDTAYVLSHADAIVQSLGGGE